ncbi:aldehyde dehydrogenase family protein [Sphaerisporangium sp. NPDC051011]|uniref:aldehyde dehydrogenase family protein n=1 Tax=Sphaerisporangium sp. NPDC051011 TaxID=3155792 RepID=UPI0033E87510
MTTTDPTDLVASQDFKLLINGELVAGASTVDVVDPSRGVAITQSPVADRNQVEQAIEAARAAFPGWRDTPIEERASVVRKMADAIEKAADGIARVVVLEQGKPLSGARDDVDWAVLWARYFAGLRLDPETVRDDDETLVQIHRRPLGVVAAITPWNFPFFQAVYKIAPAILAGNTVVLKPSPSTPLNALMLARILADIVPAGVVNVVADDGSVGPILTAHPGVDKVSFTGSTLVGKSVMRNAADTLKHITLELGGNDAAVILDDADLGKTLPEVFKWAFSNNGQVCISVKRIFAHSSIYDHVCDEFARMAGDVKLGNGLDADTDLGPIQNAKQYETAKRLLEVAGKDGKIIAGGVVDDTPGYYVRPTVVRDVAENSVLITEETFAPIRSIMSFDDDDEVVARVNDTPYGLGNSVWGSDLERATKIANRLESGTTWVNTHFALAPDVPFGGRKQSGSGFEFSREGLLQFTDVQVVHVNKA